MKPAFFQSTHTLKQQDFFLLADVFRQVVKDLLPIDSTILFWCRLWEYQKEDIYSGSAKNWLAQLDAQCKVVEPGFLLGMLVFPLVIDDGDRVAVLVQDVDPALAEKMDHEWLCELRDSIQKNLEMKRQEYVDNVTGLYNNHLLATCLEQRGQKPGVLFLVGVGNRARKLTFNLMKIVQAGRFIESIANRAVFYLGGNIFGVLNAEMNRQESLSMARRLLSRLKREGLHRVHIGISRVGSELEKVGRKAPVLNECWQALEAAEMRGPYSLCEASVLLDRARHPLARPPKDVISQLRRNWRGLKQFGLILVKMDNAEPSVSDPFDLTQLISPLLSKTESIFSVTSQEGYILVTDRAEKQTLQLCRKIAERFAHDDSLPSCSMGVCHWPTLNYTKTEMTINCRKAFMHGSFFGPGSVTPFDHVSLNVSGDYYFDEGDYRQAVRDYRFGCSMAPDDINLMNSLGVALIELNRLRESIGYFDKVLDREPDNFMALVNKGFALRIVGNDNEALKCLERASQDKKFADADVFPDLSLQLGRLYCDKGSYGKAVRILDQLALQKPEKQELGLIRLLGEAYAGNGDNKKAILLLQRAVRIYPHDARSLSLLGELYALENQGDDIALSFCELAVEIDEGPWKYWYRLAVVKNKMGNSLDALNALQKSIRRNRKKTEPLYLAGKIYKKLGEQKKSDRMFQRIVVLKSNHIDALTNLGENRKRRMR